MNTVDLQSMLIERVAKFRAMEVPKQQIAAAVGLPIEKLEALMELPVFVSRLEAITAEELEKQHTLNVGWDVVEEEALGHVLENLRNNPDRDYALRAATMANKAVRRGAGSNHSLQTNMSATTVINLSAMFVQKLQQMNITQFVPPTVDADGKRVDSLNASEVEKLFGDGAAADSGQQPQPARITSADVHAIFDAEYTNMDALEVSYG